MSRWRRRNQDISFAVAIVHSLHRDRMGDAYVFADSNRDIFLLWNVDRLRTNRILGLLQWLRWGGRVLTLRKHGDRLEA